MYISITKNQCIYITKIQRKWAHIFRAQFQLISSSKKIKLKFKKDTLDYFLKTSAILYLDEDDLIDFEENLMGINLNDWSYTKQKLLIDDRFKPTKDLISLNKYLKKVREKIDNDTK